MLQWFPNTFRVKNTVYNPLISLLWYGVHICHYHSCIRLHTWGVLNYLSHADPPNEPCSFLGLPCELDVPSAHLLPPTQLVLVLSQLPLQPRDASLANPPPCTGLGNLIQEF